MNNDVIRGAVAELRDEIISIRRTLHANPEIGNKEYGTSAFIKAYLKKCGLEVAQVLETGLVATLKLGDGNGPVIALRADMDALPVQEETGLEYASRNQGMMHACGHDIHVAALMGAARILAEYNEGLNGTIKFLFQPDEEGNGGAKRMIEAGVLENPHVDKVFGIHIRPELPAGAVAVKYGKSYAASDMFAIEVLGKSCHGAEPENGISAIRGAAEIVTQLDGLAASVVPEGEKAVISVGTLVSGNAGNIIPGRAVLQGIIRTLGQDSRAAVKNAFNGIVRIAAESQGCTANIAIKESYPGVVNHDADTELIVRSYYDLYGEMPAILEEPTMTTEDFGYFLLEREGCFYHIGAGSEYPLHNSKMAPDESCLDVAVAMHVKTVSEMLTIRMAENVQPEGVAEEIAAELAAEAGTGTSELAEEPEVDLMESLDELISEMEEEAIEEAIHESLIEEATADVVVEEEKKIIFDWSE